MAFSPKVSASGLIPTTVPSIRHTFSRDETGALNGISKIPSRSWPLSSESRIEISETGVSACPVEMVSWRYFVILAMILAKTTYNKGDTRRGMLASYNGPRRYLRDQRDENPHISWILWYLHRRLCGNGLATWVLLCGGGAPGAVAVLGTTYPANLGRSCWKFHRHPT